MPYKDIEKRREYGAKYLRIWRLKKGITKKSYGNHKFIPKGIAKKASNAKQEYSGEITSRIVQMVYEDNIKKYGTLTCYLCEKSIEFGQDSLDHKISASRGGTNDYDNLEIAHNSCNKRKQSKTVAEYKMEATQ